MGRRKKESVTRCFNIDKKIFNLLEYLTEDGFLTLTQAIEKSIKGRFISEFGQEEFKKLMNKDIKKTKEKAINVEKDEKNEWYDEKQSEKEALELEKLKAARRLRKEGASND